MKKEYKSYKELNENSVSEWAAQLDVAERRELTKEEAEFFLKLCFIEEQIEEAKNAGFKELLDGWNGVTLSIGDCNFIALPCQRQQCFGVARWSALRAKR